MWGLLGADVVEVLIVDALLNGVHVDVRNGIVAVEDTRDLLESGTLGDIVSNCFVRQKTCIHTLVSG